MDTARAQPPQVSRGAAGSGAARPLWARWSGGIEHRYTIGVEEELMLLRPSGQSPAPSSDAVLPRPPRELAEHTSPETHASGIELATGDSPGRVG